MGKEHSSNFNAETQTELWLLTGGRLVTIFSLLEEKRVESEAARTPEWYVAQPGQKIHFGESPVWRQREITPTWVIVALISKLHFNLCASLFLPLSLQPHSKFLYASLSKFILLRRLSTLKEKVYAVWWSGCAGNYMQKESESLETLSIVSLQYRTMYLVVIGNELLSQTHLLGYFTSLSPVSLICKMWVPLLVS